MNEGILAIIVAEFTTTMGIAIAGLILGITGTVLSIVNTWRLFDRDKVKLRVRPTLVKPIGGQDVRPRVSIDVLNLSVFSVTVDEVGFLYHDSTDRGMIFQPIMLDGGTFPRRLKPRTSLSAMCNPSMHLDERFAYVYCAYAETDCGVRAEGTSAALRQLIAQAKRQHG